MKKAVWLSYDLGVKGDYNALYAYLDNLGAVECGDNVGFFQMEFSGTDAELEDKIRADLHSVVRFSKADRLYLVYRKHDGKVGGKFIVGGRRASPWQGYGRQDAAEDGGL